MGRRVWILTKHVWLRYGADNCSQHAAAIAYFVLFSIVPLAILAVSILGLVLTEGAKQDIINRILDVIPLTQTEGRDSVENAVQNANRVSGPVALFGLLATLWTASAVFAAVRRGLNGVFGTSGAEPRPWAQAKLIDFVQVGLLGGILLSSIISTGVLRWVREVSAEQFGPLASDNPLWEVPPILIPAVLSFATFALLYKFVPAEHPSWGSVLPGAGLAMVLFELLKNTFAIYVSNFNNFDVVYGSLAGLLLLLLYVYLACNILLFGAEVAAVFERHEAGELDAEIYPTTPGPSVGEKMVRAFKGLFVRQPPAA